MRRCRVRMLALPLFYAVALTVPSMRPDVRHTAWPRRRPNAGRLPRMALGDDSEQLSSRWCSADRRGFLRAGPASVMLGGLFGLCVQPEQSAEPTPLLRTRRTKRNSGWQRVGRIKERSDDAPAIRRVTAM